ncbi:hypothetical protein PENANT_c070G02273 [Penicillium antarcticum]|uniref:Uncharacterized protein n=1 Tax=Penicillium antarcticum TaxID=416450 RepID=A0A1V6PPH7_9EURO|nr:hypothetical protein PENANT_c070G02273 [Penicillium antarcticum]
MSTPFPWNASFVRNLLLLRWQGQLQPHQVGQQWDDAAFRNQARVSHNSRIGSLSVVIHSGQRRVSSAFGRHREESDDTDRLPSRPSIRQVSPEPLSTRFELGQQTNVFVTSEMLRPNSVPWRVSSARPAILWSATNPLADFQNLTLQSLILSEEVDHIHGVFCLAEDEDHTKDRKEGALDALIRPLPPPTPDAETHSVHTASEMSPIGGPHHSARLAGAHLPREPATFASLRRSARLNSTQRG